MAPRSNPPRILAEAASAPALLGLAAILGAGGTGARTTPIGSAFSAPARKTPTLRDLGQSGPYLHIGRIRTLEEVIDLYDDNSDRAREGRLRSGSPEMAGIFIGDSDQEPLAAFLRSLNEDYE